ncbi:MAG: DNA/RNA non-specific endonuclease, partial [Paludibacteraceae bacterium]|nr:DNA/RNA non-specific endonuclease [Paludibacteraceae bacterium]
MRRTEQETRQQYTGSQQRHYLFGKSPRGNRPFTIIGISFIKQENDGKGGYNGYTRGHQIPSADRTATRELNEQTFYMSNMTLQAYDFNSGIWLDLENKVRGYMCNDTIYVVTGAHWENTSRYAGKYPIP